MSAFLFASLSYTVLQSTFFSAVILCSVILVMFFVDSKIFRDFFKGVFFFNNVSDAVILYNDASGRCLAFDGRRRIVIRTSYGCEQGYVVPLSVDSF